MASDNAKGNPTCWIITEGMAGTLNPCIGVANALGLEPVIINLTLAEPWKTLSPYLGFENHAMFSPRLNAPWPDLLITSGRKSIAAARYIKKMSHGQTETLHIQDPRISPKHFDLIALSAHDPLRAENVIVTSAAPNIITPALLEDAKQNFPKLSELPSPRIAVLIGGNSKAFTITESIAHRICDDLLSLKAGLMITCSRRTPEHIRDIFQSKLAYPNHYYWDGSGANPYHAFLAHADYILVTADSVSMISESCSTGKPVFMIPLEGGAKRVNAFHKTLLDQGILRVFEPDKLEKYDYEPLRDADLIANEVKKRFKLFTDGA